MSHLDPSRLLTDLQLAGFDFRRVAKSVAGEAALLIADAIGKRDATDDGANNLDDYDFSVSPEENLSRLQHFALVDFKDEENELFKNGWFTAGIFDLGVMQGYTGIDMGRSEVANRMAQAYWDTTLTLFKHHEQEFSPSTAATF